MVLAYFLYTAAGSAVIQGALARRIKDMTVADIMDREPVTIGSDVTLLDAQEQFFLRYRGRGSRWWTRAALPGGGAPAAHRDGDRRRAPRAGGERRAGGGPVGADR